MNLKTTCRPDDVQNLPRFSRQEKSPKQKAALFRRLRWYHKFDRSTTLQSTFNKHPCLPLQAIRSSSSWRPKTLTVKPLSLPSVLEVSPTPISFPMPARFISVSVDSTRLFRRRRFDARVHLTSAKHFDGVVCPSRTKCIMVVASVNAPTKCALFVMSLTNASLTIVMLGSSGR